MSSKSSQHTQWLKEAAHRHGFMGAGVSRAEHMDEEAGRLEEWLRRGYHGEMSYMANYFDLRVDPTKLVPGAKSVVSLLYNYYPEEIPSPPLKGAGGLREERTDSNIFHVDEHDLAPSLKGAGGLSVESTENTAQVTDLYKISKYAYGEDYHKVIRRKLKALVSDLKKEFGDFNARVFVDSAPVLERDWAKRSGQGWIGKNTLLIHPRKGSYFFLAEIILDVEFDYDHPMRDHCGTCTKCIEACPTDAISQEGYILDGSKCISYLTIELKAQIPESFKGQMENWIYGCDICQEVCPWNRFSSPHEEPAFNMSDDFKEMRRADWIELTEEIFDGLFEKSAVKRAGYVGLKRNITFLSSDRH